MSGPVDPETDEAHQRAFEKAQEPLSEERPQTPDKPAWPPAFRRALARAPKARGGRPKTPGAGR